MPLHVEWTARVSCFVVTPLSFFLSFLVVVVVVDADDDDKEEHVVSSVFDLIGLLTCCPKTRLVGLHQQRTHPRPLVSCASGPCCWVKNQQMHNDFQVFVRRPLSHITSKQSSLKSQLSLCMQTLGHHTPLPLEFTRMNQMGLLRREKTSRHFQSVLFLGSLSQ